MLHTIRYKKIIVPKIPPWGGGGVGSIVSSMSKSPHVSLLSVFVMWKSINLVQAFCFASSVSKSLKVFSRYV